MTLLWVRMAHISGYYRNTFIQTYNKTTSNSVFFCLSFLLCFALSLFLELYQTISTSDNYACVKRLTQGILIEKGVVWQNHHPNISFTVRIPYKISIFLPFVRLVWCQNDIGTNCCCDYDTQLAHVHGVMILLGEISVLYVTVRDFFPALPHGHAICNLVPPYHQSCWLY